MTRLTSPTAAPTVHPTAPPAVQQTVRQTAASPPLPLPKGTGHSTCLSCRTCVHHVPPGGRLTYPVCQAPGVATDLVSGRPIYGVPCGQARGRTGRCGIDGHWWAPGS